MSLCFTGTTTASRADDAQKPADGQQAHIQETLRLTRETAQSYEVHLKSEAGEPTELALVPRPILQWSNPIAGEIYGNVFLWVDRGRPEVVASLHKWYSPFTHSAHEFHSLSLGPVTAVRNGRTAWQPQRAGIELKPVPQAPAPADSPAARLRQMRELARQFTAEKTDREGVHRELRLLPQPVYRYEGERPDLIDGALFVFVQGTDPEVFLLLEARNTSGGPRWQYAPTRMNSVHFDVKHNGREVWSVPILPWNQVTDPREPYRSFRVDD